MPYDYNVNSFQQGDATQPPKKRSFSDWLLENLRVGYKSSSGGGVSYNGDVLKEQRKERDAAQAEKDQQTASNRAQSAKDYQARQAAFAKAQEEKRQQVLIDNALKTAEEITTGQRAHGRPLIGAPVPDAGAVPGAPQGLTSGPGSLNEAGAAATTMQQELQMRPRFTPTGQAEAIQQATAATQKAMEPEKPNKVSRAEIRDGYYNQWLDLVAQSGNDEKAAYDSLPFEQQKQLRIFNIYDPEKGKKNVEESLAKEIRKERQKRGQAWDKMNPFERERAGSRAEYMQQVTPLSVIVDPANEDEYRDLWDQYGVTEDNLPALQAADPRGFRAVDKIYGTEVTPKSAGSLAAGGAELGNGPVGGGRADIPAAAAAASDSSAVISQLQAQIAQESASTDELQRQLDELKQLVAARRK